MEASQPFMEILIAWGRFWRRLFGETRAQTHSGQVAIVVSRYGGARLEFESA
jgi:hypothetical protein